MTKLLYQGMIGFAEKLPEKIDYTKTYIAENRAISKKKKLIDSVSWSNEQQKEFDAFWLKNYGKKITNKWHRLYQAVSGNFCVEYIPEKIYTTVIEPFFNDRRYAKVLEDKSLIEAFARGSGCVVPETILVCSDSRFYDKKRKPISEAEAVAILASEKDYIIKPTVGSSSGKGVVFCNSLMSPDHIQKEIHDYGKDFIVQRCIIAHPSYAVFNPTSINTVRITTYIWNGKIYHFPLAFRIGRCGKKVDNIHAGGLVIGVYDDGLLCPTAFELGYGDRNIQFHEHPDSNIVFKDYHLPQVDAIIKSAYKVHGRLPHIGIVSWDFTIDAENNPVLVEANITGQSIWISQMIWGKAAFGHNTGGVLNDVSKGHGRK